MNQLDVYYRALSDYRQQTLADHNCTSLRMAIATTDTEQDKIVMTRAMCTIDNDWVDAIEEGLVHIEKAIKEERQFIRSNGEVIPIEKVKHVSRESVEHLAKHSNLITQYDNEDEIIPEKLYTVERLNDYSIYENRFLYMLLCFLRDFITVRYNEILELSNKYEAEIAFNKKITTAKQQMTYTLSMRDVKRDDPYLKENNPAKDTIDRIHLLLKTVIAFLGTPLMQEVAKVAMLKPPITKTNVLKMNNNFKGAVALYEFIMSYDKKGYQIEHQTKTLAPFQEALADELAEAGGLVSFLVYEYALDINSALRDSYLREEERRKVARIKQRNDRIETLKRKLANSEISIEEYTLTLEDQLRELSGQEDRAERLADALEAECAKTKQLTSLVERLTETVAQLHAEIEDLKQKHFEEIERMKQEHEDAMHVLIVKHEAEMQACREQYEQQIREMTEQHEQEMQALKAQHEQEVAALHESYRAELQRQKDEAEAAARQHAEALAAVQEEARARVEQLRSEHDAALTALQGSLADCTAELDASRADYEALMEDHRQTKARVKALGGMTENYTDKEGFNELEREYQAFTRLYKQQWELTKKEIKKQHLNINNLKVQKEKTKGKETKKGSDTDEQE